MNRRLCIYVCQTYLPEVKQVLATGDYPDVRVYGFPYDCTGTTLTADFLGKLCKNPPEENKQVIILGSSCLSKLKSENKQVRNTLLQQFDFCEELLLPKELISFFIQKRYYLISSGWLKNYKKHMANWGFDGKTAKTFFSESADKILMLDTGISADYEIQIDAISEYMGLPYEVLPVGISHCRILIDNLVFSWRAELERSSFNEQLSTVSKKAADYSMVFEKMLKMVNLMDEKEIVHEIFQLLMLLFVPANIIYQPFFNDKSGSEWSLLPEPVLSSSNDNDLIYLEARNRDEVLGRFTLFGLRFPQYIDQYRSMSKVIGGISGLAISNARKFKIILEDEQKLKQYNSDLELANANKDKFFSIIAHDLRSPFSAFLGLTEILSDDTESMTEDNMRKTAGMINNAAKNLFNQLENLLEWSKIQMTGISINRTDVDLNEMVESELQLLRSLALKKKVEMINSIHGQVVISTDKNLVHSIVRNLITNALKFSHPGGKVVIDLKELDKNTLEVSVIDEGIGMSASMIENLFSLHKQTNRKGTMGEPSSGLGLLLCKEFVERIGGTIGVESEEQKGSRFFFTLKRHQ